MGKPTENEIVMLASRLQQTYPQLSQQQAVRQAIEQLTGQKVVTPAGKQTKAIPKPILPTLTTNPLVTATSTFSVAPDKDWERRLRSIGLVNWPGKLTVKVAQDGIKLINAQLQSKHIGLARREQLLKLRAELRRKSFYASAPKAQMVSGGLPSLGKRR